MDIHDIIRDYGHIPMMMCAKHNFGEDYISTEPINDNHGIIITSYWDDRYDKDKLTHKSGVQLQTILDGVNDATIIYDESIDTIIIKFGNRHKKGT